MSSIAVSELLGGEELLGHDIQNDMDFYLLGKEGIPKKSLIALAKNLGLTIKALAQLVHISERTLQRKEDNELLSETTSEQILQIAEVFSRGQEVFGDRESFLTWSQMENLALQNEKPFSLLASRFGANLVLDELGRIEQGIFS